MNEQIIEQKINELCKYANGLSEDAQSRIKKLLYMAYLDGHSDGIDFAQDKLDATFKSKDNEQLTKTI